MVLNSLREWKLASTGELVFSDQGKVISHGNVLYRFWEPLQKEALGEARYGLHAMRHAAASLWIERGLNPKVIQYRMGHATIQMTFDTYGHLFHSEDTDQETAAGIEADIFATRSA